MCQHHPSSLDQTYEDFSLEGVASCSAPPQICIADPPMRGLRACYATAGSGFILALERERDRNGRMKPPRRETGQRTRNKIEENNGFPKTRRGKRKVLAQTQGYKVAK